jgi:hypothetical protein
MLRTLVAGAALLLATAASAANLTPLETRWLEAAWPVIEHAREIGLPLDIVVQPQPEPGLPPLAMAYLGGRCKLVLSMRGNAAAEATLRELPDEIRDAALELMAAHEIGHCQRHIDGAWHGVPAGFTPIAPAHLSPALRKAYDAMQATRREEAFGDLVGLAWIARKRPREYARLHAWLVAERSKELIPGSHHDTLAWLALVKDPVTLEGETLFEGPTALWRRGLAARE